MRANHILTTQHFPEVPLFPIIRCRTIALEEGPTTMKRYQKFISPIVLGLFIWAVGLRYCAVTEECAKPWPEVIEIQPLYWLIVFGCYALAKIGLGLIAFKDCSGDAIGLDQDIKAAREDLTNRGFQFS